MKVLALNSSPRAEGQSKTEMILKPFVEGMRQAGAQVEVVNLRQKTIRNCAGCFTCWTKTPGVCIHKDDMTRELYPKWLAADIAVYASPLYHYTMTASMKAFIERTLPVLEPFFEQRDGKTWHPLRHPAPKAVVMSVAGFPEMKVFDQLSAYVQFLFKQGLLAEIYRPGAESLAHLASSSVREKILAALYRAGEEIIQTQKIRPETLSQITQPIGIESQFAKLGNLMWRTCIAESVTPKEMVARGIAPRPDSIETFMLILPLGFQAAKAGNLAATLQFDFSGEIAGSCHFVIAKGQMKAVAGSAAKPDLTIKTPFALWADIMTGKADGQKTFMEQKYQAAGDFSLLMKFGELFEKG
ncbi:MAG: NAD(P)H-dependent oxidoreductase [Desulfobacteraceae bacterium]|nr:NAD(P)H-dependent oxidoreductase [Desulfobacteraceae bacterium]